MNESALPRELALRIGLAARALPDTEPARLMAVLVDALGLPLTRKKLDAIDATQLRMAADGELTEMPPKAIEQAVALLRGEGEQADAALPTPTPLTEGEMADAIRVAFASNTATQLDGHFGSCARFLIYQIDADNARLIDLREVGPTPDGEDKNGWRAQLIQDCQLLYVVSIGGPAAARVVRSGVHPIKIPDGGEIEATIARLQHAIANNPPPWLAKVMGIPAEQRVHFETSGEEV